MARASLDFLIRETEAAYRAKAKTHLTSHALADFRRCPLLYRKKQQGLAADEDRPAYFVGRASHVLILEGIERFEDEYAVGGPINPRTNKAYGSNTKAWAEWAATIGRPVLAEDQFELIVNLTTSVRAHPIAAGLLSNGVPEGVVRAEYAGRPCQRESTSSIPSAGSSTSRAATT